MRNILDILKIAKLLLADEKPPAEKTISPEAAERQLERYKEEHDTDMDEKQLAESHGQVITKLDTQKKDELKKDKPNLENIPTDIADKVKEQLDKKEEKSDNVEEKVEEKELWQKNLEDMFSADSDRLKEELKALKSYDKNTQETIKYWMNKEGSQLKPKEDWEIIKGAIDIAKNKGVEPKSYDSPVALTNAFVGEVKGKKINPDEVKQFKFSHSPEGKPDIKIYDVDDNEEGQQAVREILDTHIGINSNPWCGVIHKKAKMVN